MDASGLLRPPFAAALLTVLGGCGCGPSAAGAGGTAGGSGEAGSSEGSTTGSSEGATSTTQDVPAPSSCGNGQREPGELCLVPLDTELPMRRLRKGEFNGDGNLDVAHVGIEGSSFALRVFAGDGAGGFDAASPVFFDAEGTVSLFADFGAGATTDVALVDIDAGSISTFLNDGVGGLIAPTISTELDASAPWNVAIVLDADGDGKSDLLTEPLMGGSTLTVLTNDGSGSFVNEGLTAPVAETCTYTASAPIPPFSALMGGLVFLAAECASGPSVDEPLTFTWTRSPGMFVADLGPQTGEGPTHLVVGDFDGDENPELFVWHVGSQKLSLYEAGFVGSFQHASDFALDEVCASCEPTGDDVLLRSLHAADLDGDPATDLVVVVDETVHFGLNPLTENPTWDAEPIFAPHVVVGDFNNDGSDDLLVEQTVDEPVILFLSDP